MVTFQRRKLLYNLVYKQILNLISCKHSNKQLQIKSLRSLFINKSKKWKLSLAQDEHPATRPQM